MKALHAVQSESMSRTALAQRRPLALFIDAENQAGLDPFALLHLLEFHYYIVARIAVANWHRVEVRNARERLIRAGFELCSPDNGEPQGTDHTLTAKVIDVYRTWGKRLHAVAICSDDGHFESILRPLHYLGLEIVVAGRASTRSNRLAALADLFVSVENPRRLNRREQPPWAMHLIRLIAHLEAQGTPVTSTALLKAWCSDSPCPQDWLRLRARLNYMSSIQILHNCSTQSLWLNRAHPFVRYVLGAVDQDYLASLLSNDRKSMPHRVRRIRRPRSACQA